MRHPDWKGFGQHFDFTQWQVGAVRTERRHYEWISSGFNIVTLVHMEKLRYNPVVTLVSSHVWRCTLWKVFFLASPAYVLVEVPANLLAENFRTVSIPSVPANPVALGCVVVPLYLMDFPPIGVYAWFDSGYMHYRIWQHTVRCLRCPRYTVIFGFSGKRLCAPCTRLFSACMFGPTVDTRSRTGRSCRLQAVRMLWVMASRKAFGIQRCAWCEDTLMRQSTAPLMVLIFLRKYGLRTFTLTGVFVGASVNLLAEDFRTVLTPSVPADPVLQVWSDSRYALIPDNFLSHCVLRGWRLAEGFVTYTAEFSGKYEQVHFIIAMDGARRRLEVIHAVLTEPPFWTSVGHYVRRGLEVCANLEIQRSS